MIICTALKSWTGDEGVRTSASAARSWRTGMSHLRNLNYSDSVLLDLKNPCHLAGIDVNEVCVVRLSPRFSKCLQALLPRCRGES